MSRMGQMQTINFLKWINKVRERERKRKTSEEVQGQNILRGGLPKADLLMMQGCNCGFGGVL